MEHEPGLIAVMNRPTGLTESYACLTALSKPAGTGTAIITGTNVPRQRNEAVSTLLAQPRLRWLLFVDDDQTYPRDALLRLLATRQTVVSAVITGKYPPYQPWVFFEEEGGRVRRAEGRELAGSRVIQVAAVGTGFLLVRRKVFEAVPAPWFEFGVVAGADGTGEDILFGLKARQAGFTLTVDSGLKIGHLTVVSARLRDDGTPELTHDRYVEYQKTL